MIMAGSGRTLAACRRARVPSNLSQAPVFRAFATCQTRSNSIPGHYGHLPYKDYPAQDPSMTVDHVVIGGGAVGLAIAASLARRYPEKSTFLLERHGQVGQETSSRNSEVIHGGMYYPLGSLKTQLCIRGREMMYDWCEKNNVGAKEVGKLIVGPSSSKEYFENMIRTRNEANMGPLAPPLELLTGDQAREMDPDLGQEIGWAVHSPRTGIVSSHEYMESLEREIQDLDNAEIAYGTDVVRIDPHLPSQKASAGESKRGADASQEGWIVQTTTDGGAEGQSDSVLARVVINSSGLNGHLALNTLLAQERFAEGSDPLGMWYSKGNYLSYKGEGVRSVKRLIYPLPNMGSSGKSASSGSHESLGTHLTLDLSGNVKFGPDTEWLTPPSSTTQDFWAKLLAPTTDPERLERMYESITAYLPNVQREGLSPDYAGIRPKIVPPGADFMDFTPLWHYSRNLQDQRLWQYARLPREYAAAEKYIPKSQPTAKIGEAAQDGGVMLTLAGIESPGLTSSLALAEMVSDMITEQVWGYGEAQRQQKQRGGKSSSSGNGSGSTTIPKGARNDEVGGVNLDAWA